MLALALIGCAPETGVPDASLISPDGSSRVDAQVRDGGQPADAGFPGLSTPCETGADCVSGYCVDALVGRRCSALCDEGCPAGWDCRVVDSGGRLVSLCVPPIPPICTPCVSDEQCAGGSCFELQGESSCLPACFEGSCPDGYDCAEDPSGARSGLFCIPRAGSCTCTPETAGAIRTCSVGNAIGTCFGVETCQPETGWGDCDARTPTAEVCDGTDDDCNFLIDDAVDGSSCTNDVPGVGSCAGVTRCFGSAGIVCQGPVPTPERCNYVDDDCDGTIDEGFTRLGEICSDGTGACNRFGVIRCTADERATECSAAAGLPVPEACNGIDDDCDGPIDEAFPALRTPCQVGDGVCERIGSLVCRPDGAGTQCSVSPGTPAMEVCNGLDDDCNGVVDDPFRNPATGAYDRDTACGSCGVDCTRIFGLPNAFGVCEGSGGPQCALRCNPDAFDLNAVQGDGCEFALDRGAIYVSVSDPAASDVGSCGLGPIGTGAGHRPCRTIARGLARANETSRGRVLVANGIYDEPVALVNGRSLLGGYRWDTWERDLSATGTLIQGVASSGIHLYTVSAIDITSPTLFEGFIVRGAVNGNVGGNSYAIYVSGSSASLVLRHNQVIGGRGGPGASGTLGGEGAAGPDGVGRDSAGVVAATYDARIASGAGACDPANDRQYPNGGDRLCGSDDVGGGNGGGNRCPPSSTLTKQSAIDGFPGDPGAGTGGGAAGAGGEAGYDMTLTFSMGGLRCILPTGPGGRLIPTEGADGAPGERGTNGAAGSGCASPVGTVTGGHWVGGSGSAGAAGRNGGGGGGGGAGGGSYCDSAQCGNTHRLGAHGGGGGAGGCGGVGGGNGSGGGGALGIFIVGGSSAPVVTNNTIVRGEGGPGGRGGVGGGGGAGGAGAAGGTSTEFCARRAGRGGNGGPGGHGAGGGGGCGGASVGIFSSGAGSPGYCSPAAGNAVSGGTGGAAGPGGFSLGSAGTAGAPGSLGACTAL